MKNLDRTAFTETDDGRLLFSADYTDMENLVTWLMTFGAKVEVLEPKEARGHYPQECGRNIKNLWRIRKMTFDYKKEYKEFYMPKGTPSIVTVPKMNYIAVRGSGNPNDADGEYKQSIGLLYGIAFTIKMSKKEDHQIDGYFDYVVPPLEGFWWQGGGIRGRHAANRPSRQARRRIRN